MRTLSRLPLRHLLLCFFLAINLPMWAQGFGVSGRVCDGGENGAPLPLVKVSLLTTDSVAVARQVSGNDGRFSIGVKTGGIYLVEATFVGYDPLYKKVTLSDKHPRVSLGDLTLQPSAVLLGDANVTALSSVLTIKADTFVYSTKAMRVPPGASLSALIKQMPGLEMDKDGKLTFQGKEVSGILVNGKEFFSDNVTALQNMPADAVQDVKAYEKTDEEKEFRGVVDTDKATVLDLTIKKEYLASWNLNADAAYGTDERYLGKLFGTTFTDHRRIALFGSVNNVSENQQADENGNWTNWSYPDGLYTYRSAGGMLSWDNGRGNKEKGRVKASLNAKVTHNDNSRNAWEVNESFLPDGSAQHAYGFNHKWKHNASATVSGQLSWNIDSLNRLEARGSYSSTGYRGWYTYRNSVYDRAQSGDDPHLGLLADDIPPVLREQGIYSLWSNQQEHRDGTGSSLHANYTHLFNKEGRSLSLNGSYSRNDNSTELYNLTRYLYFNPGASQPQQLLRHLHDTPSDDATGQAVFLYSDRIASVWRYNLGLGYEHSRSGSDRMIYYLNEYDAYNSLLLPVGALPLTTDSLMDVLNAANSYVGTVQHNKYVGGASVEAQWKKAEMSIDFEAYSDHEKLFYDRDGISYRPSRTTFNIAPHFYVRWKYNENGSITFYYNGQNRRRDLLSQLPVSDTSDGMQVSINNPNLKDGWSNYFSLNGNRFGKKRGDSYSFYIYGMQYLNDVAATRRVDPVSGATYSSYANVNGNFNFYGRLSTEQPLDSARHWILSAGVSGGASRNRSYIGSDGDADGLNTINSYSANGWGKLRWRQDIWTVTLSANYEGSYTRYAHLPSYNQTGHTAYATIAPQVELPFGLRISTDICYYRRFNYADPIMNHRQLLWNANISQDFLRSKALTIRLEAVDLLHERTAEYNFLSATMRQYSRVDSFLSYVLLHVVYRFNLKRG